VGVHSLAQLATMAGMLTYNASLCAASVKVLEESATPDVQCVFAPASYKPGLIRKLHDKPGSLAAHGRCGHSIARLTRKRPEIWRHPAQQRRTCAPFR
jgi:hypothetical protein